MSGFTTNVASEWAKTTLRAIDMGIADGSIRTCPHVPRPVRTVHAIALKWGAWACPDCAPDMVGPDRLDAPHTCDVCGRDISEEHQTDGFASVNGVALGYTTCEQCAAGEEAELKGKAGFTKDDTAGTEEET